MNTRIIVRQPGSDLSATIDVDTVTLQTIEKCAQLFRDNFVSFTYPFPLEMAQTILYLCQTNGKFFNTNRFKLANNSTIGFRVIKCMIYLGITKINFDILDEFCIQSTDFGALVEIAKLVNLGIGFWTRSHCQLLAIMRKHFPKDYHKTPYPTLILNAIFESFDLHYQCGTVRHETTKTVEPCILINDMETGKFIECVARKSTTPHGFTLHNNFVISNNTKLYIINPFMKKMTSIPLETKSTIHCSRKSTKIIVHVIHDTFVKIVVYDIIDMEIIPCYSLTLQNDHLVSYTSDMDRTILLDDNQLAIVMRSRLQIWNFTKDRHYDIITGNVSRPLNIIGVDLLQDGLHFAIYTITSTILVNRKTLRLQKVVENETIFRFQTVTSNDDTKFWFILNGTQLYCYNLVEEYLTVNRYIKHCRSSTNRVEVQIDPLRLVYTDKIGTKIHKVTVLVQ